MSERQFWTTPLTTGRDYRFAREEEEPKFKASKIGDEYNYPLPESKEDPWLTLLKPLQEKDEVRCKAWKEEVENLLIFAGLFSAVVTAFILESYKTLLQDPADVTVLLLSRILDNTGGGPQINSTIPDFSPIPSNIHINILWFLSLVLSLATVLVGIVSLQWLREHRPRADIPPQLAYSLFHMRTEGLDRWYLPQILMLLPILLQLGLVLFLAGIIEFLWQLNRSAAIPIVIAIILVFLFLATTTVFPTAQALFLFIPRWSKGPRFQCSYMSPQSWAFHRLITYLLHLGLKLRLFHGSLDRGRSFNAATVVSESRPKFQRLLKSTDIIFRLANKDTWLDHGIGWLYQRDLDFLSASDDSRVSIIPLQEFVNVPPPMFDAVTALRSAVETRSSKTDDEIMAEQNSIQKLSVFALETYEPSYFRYFQQTSASKHSFPPSRNRWVLQDQFLYSFGHGYRKVKDLGTRRHQLEMALRFAEWCFTSKHQVRLNEDMVEDMLLALESGIPDFPGSELHLLDLVKKFFSEAAKFYPSEEELGQTSYTTSHIKGFLTEAEVIFADAPSATRHHLDPIFRSITSHLRSSLGPSHEYSSQTRRPDYLFYTAVIYTTRMRMLQIYDAERVSSDLRTLAATLSEYEGQMERNVDLEQCLGFDYDSMWLHPHVGIILVPPSEPDATSDPGSVLPVLTPDDEEDAKVEQPTPPGASAKSFIAFPATKKSDMKGPKKNQPLEELRATSSSTTASVGNSSVDNTANPTHRPRDVIVDVLPPKLGDNLVSTASTNLEPSPPNPKGSSLDADQSRIEIHSQSQNSQLDTTFGNPIASEPRPGRRESDIGVPGGNTTQDTVEE